MASIGGLPAATIDAGCRAGAAFALAVIERSVGADCRDASGLSVFAPDSDTVFSANRAEYARLRFPTLTGWDAVLDVVYGHYSDEVHLAARSVPAPVPVEAATDDPIILLGQLMIRLANFLPD